MEGPPEGGGQLPYCSGSAEDAVAGHLRKVISGGREDHVGR